MYKIINNKNQTKKIIIMVLIVLLFNFVIPTYSQAGTILNLFANMLVFFPDKLIEGLQEILIGDGYIVKDGKYSIKVSPGIIFSGKIPLLDINFIDPKFADVPIYEQIFVTEYVRTYAEIESIDYKYENNETVRNKLLNDVSGTLELEFYTWNETLTYLVDPYDECGSAEEDPAIFILYDEHEEDIEKWEEWQQSIANTHNQILTVKDRLNDKSTWSNVDAMNDEIEIMNNLLEQSFRDMRDIVELLEDYSANDVGKDDAPIVEEFTRRYIIHYGATTTIDVQVGTESRSSVAYILKDLIATWYNVLKTFSLVALLSILVYIAIRMIISSAAKDKVKYKKMFQGWFEAMCILLVLHFLISATFIGVQAITDVFAKTIEGPSGENEDKLMTDIRNDIETAKSGEDYGNAFFNILLYLVLFIYTLSFGVQYLKRVVYVAFLILISPLIALTYPLDKINDGKAQAFEVWLKEFLFNVLLQPLHLLIYCLLVGNATELIETNGIYALVAVGSLLPVEKFIRRMFGLESNSSMGNMSSALGGAAIMNSINKLGSGGGKSKSGSKGGSTPSKPNNVRTVNEGVGDPYEVLRSGGTSPGTGNGPASSTGSRKYS